LASSSSQAEEKKEKHRKKKHRERKKWRKGKELTFLLSLLHLGWSIPFVFSSPPSSSLVSTFPRNSVLLKFENSLELWKWNEWEMRWEKEEGGGGSMCDQIDII
jgi:hypothetical protein